MRWLIINADDFGLCYAANEAVERLFDEGAITTATLMVPAPFAADGVERAKKNPRMTIGLHLTTTCEYESYRWGPIDRTCLSLAAADGGFYRTAADNLLHATMEDMQKEIRAQYDWMALRGLEPEHIDSHMATVYGWHGMSCLDSALRLCAQHGLNFRYPRTPEVFPDNISFELRAAVEAGTVLADRLGVGIPRGLYTYDFDVMPEDTYESFRGAYMDMVHSCPEGVSELFMHPCIETDQLKQINMHWKKRVWEYRVLLDPVFRTCIAAENIHLTTYRDAPFEHFDQ